MAELEGKTLDRYELRRLIGKGGMANVYEAYDPNFHRVVAVKVFKREDEEMLRRFIREAQLMSKLHHPRLVQIYDSGDCLLDGITRYYIVLPLLAGGTLRAYIRRSPLSLSTICRCLRDIARALDYIHSEHIIHRDIKASNVLLDDEGQCFLTDFGIARITTDATQLTSTGNVLGTADYVAPELFEVHRRADARSDLYSLGVLLYEMVTGRLPFTADNQLALISMQVSKTAPSPRQFVPQLPSQVERVMYKALEKNPDLRYASAIELADSFCRAASQPASDVVEQVSRSNMARANLAATAIKTETEASRDRPSTLASATEGFSYTTPPRVQPPGSLSPDTPVLPSSARIRRKNVVGKRPAFTVILGLLILLVLAIPLAYAAFNRSASKQNTITQNTATTSSQSPISGQSSTTPDAAQTTQIAATATAAAKVQATASAIAAATATARAQATATVGPIATATGGQPTYADPLDNANSPATQEANWDQNNQCMFASDGYHVLQPASVPYFKGCREQSNTYANLALSVNMIILTGHSGGVFFRLSTNLIGNYDGYLFEVDTRGNYKFSREQGSSVIPIQDWRSSPALRTGYNVKNVLQLIARGDTFLFYANGRFLMQARDTYSNQANTIGLLATSENGGSDAEVVYNTLKVYALT